MKKAKQIAFCGILAALSIVIMFLGSVIWIFTYIAPLLCSLIMLIIKNSTGRGYAFSTFAAVGIVSIIFQPDKECALTYIFFFGYYTIIKENLEKIKPWICSLAVKLLIFNGGIVLSQLILLYVFHIPLDNFLGKWGIAILLVLANLIFFLYEKMLGAISLIYDRKYRKKMERLLK